MGSFSYGRLTQFIKLNKISALNKNAVLLTHLSDESYHLIQNLVYPNKLKGTVYNELVNVLNDHFTPKRSTFVDRAIFYKQLNPTVRASELSRASEAEYVSA